MGLLEELQGINTFVFDIDGVLTDASVLVLDDGQQVRRMNIKDGYALQLAVKKNYKILIVSGGDAKATLARFQRLGITDVHLNVKDKAAFLTEFVQANNLNWERIMFMGDDIPDYGAMLKSGVPCCPADAAAEIKSISKYISAHNGGCGCVRDVIEKVLKLNNDWELHTDIASK